MNVRIITKSAPQFSAFFSDTVKMFGSLYRVVCVAETVFRLTSHERIQFFMKLPDFKTNVIFLRQRQCSLSYWAVRNCFK
jgi:hypothetical protein